MFDVEFDGPVVVVQTQVTFDGQASVLLTIDGSAVVVLYGLVELVLAIAEPFEGIVGVNSGRVPFDGFVVFCKLLVEYDVVKLNEGFVVLCGESVVGDAAVVVFGAAAVVVMILGAAVVVGAAVVIVFGAAVVVVAGACGVQLALCGQSHTCSVGLKCKPSGHWRQVGLLRLSSQ